MKKKLLSILLAICMFVPMSLSLVACDDGKDPTDPAATQTSSKESTIASDNITLSYTSTVYDGTEKEPTVVVKYDDKVISSDNYTVTYTNNINVGTATVVVTSNADSEELAAGLTFTTTFEIERHPIYVATSAQLNAAIQVTDENHVIVLEDNINDRDGSNKVIPIIVFAGEKNYDVAIDLNGFDINSHISLRTTYNGETTENRTNLKIFNSSNQESVVGGTETEVDYAFRIFSNVNNNIELENVKFQGYWGGIYTNGSYTSETVVNAKDCKFIATKEGNNGGTGVGAYLVSSKHIFNFENCTFEGFTACNVKAGHHTFENCTMNATATVSIDPSHNGNGGTNTGSALMIDSCEGYNHGAATGYPRALTVDIIGGRYTSISKYAIEQICTYNVTRECYASVHVSGDVVFEANDLLEKDYSFEDDAIVLGLDVEHVHVYNIHTQSNATHHFEQCYCGATRNEEAHTWNAGTLISTATFEVDGTKKHTCTTCGRQEVLAYQYATDRTKVNVASAAELNEAINNVDANKVIVLTADIDAVSTPILIYPTGKDYNVAIDLNGFDINSYIRIVSKNNNVNTDKLATVYIFNSSNEESVVGNDTAISYGIVIMTNNNFNVNLKNITFRAYTGGIATNGLYTSETVVNAKDCKFVSAKVGGSSLGAYLVSAKHIFNFNNCEFTGFDGYYTKAGHHTLTNCTVSGTGVPPQDASYNGSGANNTGSALIIDSAKGYGLSKATGYESALTVNVIGGTYSSVARYAIEEVSTYDKLLNKVSYAKVTVEDAEFVVSNAVETPISFENIEANDDHVFAADDDAVCDHCGVKRDTDFVDVWNGTTAAVPAAVDGVITITTAEQLAGLAASVNSGTKYTNIVIRLAKNIDLNNYEWTPIGHGHGSRNTAFTGTFDGQGFTIYNLKITTFRNTSNHNNVKATDVACGVGLFGSICDNATVKNIVINGAEVYGNHYVAAVVGYTSAYCSIENCTVYNAVINCEYANDEDSGDKAGVIAGLLQNTRMSYCTAYNSTVSASRDAGTLAGCISESYSSYSQCSCPLANNVVVSWNGLGRGTNINQSIVGSDRRA